MKTIQINRSCQVNIPSSPLNLRGFRLVSPSCDLEIQDLDLKACRLCSGFIAWLRILNQKSLNDPGFHRTKKTSANKMWVACAKITVLTLVTCWFLWKNRYILEVKLQTVELLPPKKQSRSCDFCSPFCHLRNPSYPSWKLTYPTFGDDVPFPKVGYVSFLEDKLSSVPCNSWRLTTTCAAI